MAETINLDGATIHWRGKEAAEKLRRKLRLRMQAACEMVVGQVKRNISTSTRSAGPSQPGEFPHADTGRLRNSIFWRVDETGTFVDGIVGTPLAYGIFLERGTSRMEARSFLRRTVAEMRERILQVLGRRA